MRRRETGGGVHVDGEDGGAGGEGAVVREVGGRPGQRAGGHGGIPGGGVCVAGTGGVSPAGDDAGE